MPSTNEPQWRCYSIASKAGADTLDFFIARVKGGAVSPRLCNLKVGETILLDTEMNGMLIESRLQPGGRDLWLLSTGTGVAPFVAIVSDDSIMDKYERVFLVHGVRNWNETQYLQHVLKLQPKLRVMASVTRDEGAVIDVRIPDALESGLLEATAEAKLTPQASRDAVRQPRHGQGCSSQYACPRHRQSEKRRTRTASRRKLLALILACCRFPNTRISAASSSDVCDV